MKTRLLLFHSRLGGFVNFKNPHTIYTAGVAESALAAVRLASRSA